jgi:enoyl-CoA hydratase
MHNTAPLFEFITPYIACITLNRGALSNRLNVADLKTLQTHFEAAKSARVLILKSHGKVFSAGFDLDELLEGQDRSDTQNHFEACVNAFHALQCLTLTVIQGAIVGGATDFALASDIAICSPSASFYMPAAKIGVPLYGSALERYVSRLGLAKTKRLLFLGEKLTAAQMLESQIVSEISDNLEAKTLEIAIAISALPPIQAQAMKAALNSGTYKMTLTAHEKLRAVYDLDVIRKALKPPN